jgi:phosphosulfolactate synthase (CoM biosynthesis protein A)
MDGHKQAELTLKPVPRMWQQNYCSICGEWIMLSEKFGWESMMALENEAIQSKVSSNWQP